MVLYSVSCYIWLTDKDTTSLKKCNLFELHPLLMLVHTEVGQFTSVGNVSLD